jgi:hypothetical protein
MQATNEVRRRPPSHVTIAGVRCCIFARLNWMGNGIMILIFFATEYLNMKLTVGLPYSGYKSMLSVISIGAPIVTTIVSYWALKKKFSSKVN